MCIEFLAGLQQGPCGDSLRCCGFRFSCNFFLNSSSLAFHSSSFSGGGVHLLQKSVSAFDRRDAFSRNRNSFALCLLSLFPDESLVLTRSPSMIVLYVRSSMAIAGLQVFHSHCFTAKKYRLLFLAIFIAYCSSKLEVRGTSRDLAKPK